MCRSPYKGASFHKQLVKRLGTSAHCYRLLLCVSVFFKIRNQFLDLIKCL